MDLTMIRRIGLIGVGKLGLPCGEVIAEKFFVEGFDIISQNPSNFHMKGIRETCKEKDVIFVAVPTPHDPEYGGEVPISTLPKKNFSYEIVKDVLKQIVIYTPSNQRIVLISTVIPGTCRKEFEGIIDGRTLIYNPYLIAMGSVKEDMRQPEMLIIGTKDGNRTKDVESLLNFYNDILAKQTRIIVGTWEEAESVKIFYNTFISAKLSLVNMIQDVSEKLGHMNVDVVTNALKDSSERIMSPKYMKAGMGDGGACHPRDNIALGWLAKELKLGYDLFGAIMESREVQANNLARKLGSLADHYGHSKIWIHGKAFKPFIELTDGSYSLLVSHFLTNLNYDVGFVDPLTGDIHTKVHGVILLAHCPEVTYPNNSSTKTAQYCDFEVGSVIVDPWRKIKSQDYPNCYIYHYGNTRQDELTEV
jgi:UDPglucose 6-dehydrogenase